LCPPIIVYHNRTDAGMFAFAIWDTRDNSLFLARDHLGQKPLFFYWNGDEFLFASEVKGILASGLVKPEIDLDGLWHYVSLRFIPDRYSLFKGVQKLSPGELIVFSKEGVKKKRHLGFRVPKDKMKDEQSASRTYLELLGKAVEARTESDRDVGVFLSGGLDTSANVALAARAADKRIKTFTIGFDDPAFDERPFADIVAKHFNTEHFEYVITGREIDDLPRLVWNLEEPYFELGLFLTYLGLKSAKQEAHLIWLRGYVKVSVMFFLSLAGGLITTAARVFLK